MQKEVITTVTVDDFDGETAAERRTFSLPGLPDTQYEIDLGDENWAGLQGALETVLLAHGRAVPVRDEVAERRAAKKVSAKRRSRSGKTAQVGPTSAEVRAWAAENNVEVPKSGRLPKTAFEAYHAAHAG